MDNLRGYLEPKPALFVRWANTRRVLFAWALWTGRVRCAGCFVFAVPTSTTVCLSSSLILSIVLCRSPFDNRTHTRIAIENQSRLDSGKYVKKAILGRKQIRCFRVNGIRIRLFGSFTTIVIVFFYLWSTTSSRCVDPEGGVMRDTHSGTLAPCLSLRYLYS